VCATFFGNGLKPVVGIERPFGAMCARRFFTIHYSLSSGEVDLNRLYAAAVGGDDGEA